MVTLDHAPMAELSAGVVFRCQVGSHNASRDLTTGFVEFRAGAELPAHKHPFGESITVLAGELTVDVEDRRYRFGPLDHVSVSAELVHAARNEGTQTAIAHIALASDSPSRQLVDGREDCRVMPADAEGWPGAERVTRVSHARRYSLHPNVEFVDYCNEGLLPGFAMSGGYGRFAQGGRLPAHVHDFDESICIMEGEATCVVEGRRYRLSGTATALVPRGRVHYFTNESPQPMAMIWFYAGPMPERIVVDERCATLEGDPWKTGP
jgi:quercetin dioxygenase-like cupin family protein